jgi:hypothetical protein
MSLPALAASNTAWGGQTYPLFFSRSTDAGATWDIQNVIPAGLTPADGYVEGFGGDVYDWAEPVGNTIAFVVGDNWTDLVLMKSTDGGESWSKPIKVNQDKTRSHQFMTAIAVDQTNGDLHIVFYDRCKYKATEKQTDVAWCMSKDGGNSFQQQTISEKSFSPNEKVFFGDYLGISAVNGRVRPIWPRMDNGKISLWTALIDLK